MWVEESSSGWVHLEDNPGIKFVIRNNKFEEVLAYWFERWMKLWRMWQNANRWTEWRWEITKAMDWRITVRGGARVYVWLVDTIIEKWDEEVITGKQDIRRGSKKMNIWYDYIAENASSHNTAHTKVIGHWVNWHLTIRDIQRSRQTTMSEIVGVFLHSSREKSFTLVEWTVCFTFNCRINEIRQETLKRIGNK